MTEDNPIEWYSYSGHEIFVNSISFVSVYAFGVLNIYYTHMCYVYMQQHRQCMFYIDARDHLTMRTYTIHICVMYICNNIGNACFTSTPGTIWLWECTYCEHFIHLPQRISCREAAVIVKSTTNNKLLDCTMQCNGNSIFPRPPAL